AALRDGGRHAVDGVGAALAGFLAERRREEEMTCDEGARAVVEDELAMPCAVAEPLRAIEDVPSHGPLVRVRNLTERGARGGFHRGGRLREEIEDELTRFDR